MTVQMSVLRNDLLTGADDSIDPDCSWATWAANLAATNLNRQNALPAFQLMNIDLKHAHLKRDILRQLKCGMLMDTQMLNRMFNDLFPAV